MHRLLFFVAFVCFGLLNAQAQSRLGDVACVYVTTTDLDSSLAVYEKLGFSKTAANDFPSPWIQIWQPHDNDAERCHTLYRAYLLCS